VPETAALWLTLPHWDTLQERLHVTPLPEESPLMVAVSESVPVASIEFTLAVTATLMCGPINMGDPPPQLLSINVETTARPAQRKLRSMIPFPLDHPNAALAPKIVARNGTRCEILLPCRLNPFLSA